jgi:hypothetical protein
MGANDMRDARRPAPPDAASDAGDRQWHALLAGSVLSPDGDAAAGGAMRHALRHALHLCSDARYHVETIPHGRADAGRWDVQVADAGALLLLRSDGGDVSAHAVAFAGGATFVGGQPVIRMESTHCH